jgi:hypothetical protein
MHRSPGRPRLRTLGAALLWASLLAALAGGTSSCGPGKREPAPASPAADAEWTWLQQAKRTLDGQRATTTGSGTGAADPKLARGLSRDTEALAGEFNRRLVELLNTDPPVQGEPLSERQQAALRMKSDEDILLARQFIEQGGDYERAINIYREALVVDPGNPRLREELAKAQARRYITREVFDQIKEGMEQEEVRSRLGQPNLHSVRDYPDRGVVGWFYPKDRSGAAAAVWFHKEAGRATVYLLDFDALAPNAPAGPAEPPRAPQRST